ncbi:MAG: hypothetical protein ABI721_04240 [Candidatus Dojkabacteria bacterium]
MEYPFIVFLHAVYLFGWAFISQKLFFKKFSYKNYVFLSIILGLVGGIISDIFGVLMFKLWEYPISAPAEYLIFILIFAYIVSVPFILETTLWVEGQLRKLSFIKLPNPNKIVYWLLLIVSVIGTIIVSIYQLQRGGVVDVWFIPILLFFATLLTGSILSIFDVENFLSDTFQGKFLTFFAPFLAGLLTGLAWEILNSRIILYSITNVPSGKILEISISALIGWGELNVAFYGVAKFMEVPFMKKWLGKYFIK